MLKKFRIVLASLMLCGITLLFLGIGHDWWGWMAKLQFLPALLRLTADAAVLNILAVAGILLFTFIFGRLYCSVICPLGIFQDLVFRFNPGRKKMSFKSEKKWLRYTVWTLYVIALIVGLQVVIALLAPYSAYGRMISSFPSAIAFITLFVIVAFAVLSGRGWCNDICPVGTTLSFFSRFAIFKPTIDTDKCKSCKKCEKACRAHCIDISNKKIDYSRCVDCFDCLDNCAFGAISYKASAPKAAKTESDGSRRAFLSGSVLALGGVLSSQTKALAQAATKMDGGFAEVLPKQAPERSERLVPPGARSVKDFYSRCTACQLCVEACPNGVLRPSTDLEHFMQPVMSYENGFCRPECTACSQVCPAGAILPVSKEEKTAIHIGKAHIDYNLCVVNADEVNCGNCARHCPAGAIMMVEGPDGRNIPSVIEDMCIGCGECEFLCPSRPISAITVDGRKQHIIS